MSNLQQAVKSRQPQRDKINADIQAYLAKGGKVDKLESDKRADPKCRIGFNGSLRG